MALIFTDGFRSVESGALLLFLRHLYSVLFVYSLVWVKNSYHQSLCWESEHTINIILRVLSKSKE